MRFQTLSNPKELTKAVEFAEILEGQGWGKAGEGQG
jgi:hypothetical protein